MGAGILSVARGDTSGEVDDADVCRCEGMSGPEEDDHAIRWEGIWCSVGCLVTGFNGIEVVRRGTASRGGAPWTLECRLIEGDSGKT